MKVDYRELLKAATLSPRQSLMFIFGLAMPFIGLNQYWTQTLIDWRGTQGKLIDITVHERKFSDKEQINYLVLVHEYSANNKTFQANSEEVQYSNSGIDARMETLRAEKKSITIYYDADNPSHFTFCKSETKPDLAFLITMVFTGLMIAVTGYWLVKVRYRHYYGGAS